MTPQEWRALAGRTRGALDRADLGDRARRVAEFAIKATLMQCRTRVVIPNRSDLCRLLRIGKNHVAEVVAGLESAGIVKFTATADGWELLVFPDADRWAVEWFYSRDEMSAYLDVINRAPGQVQGELIEPPPSLARVLAEVSAQNAGERQGAMGDRCSQKGNLSGGTVPKKGTAFKEGSKPQRFKAFTEFETLKEAVAVIREPDEHRAMDGIRAILGPEVMENDGGKWRLRWRSDRAKTWRVMAATAEDRNAGKVRNTGAHSEFNWKQFA